MRAFLTSITLALALALGGCVTTGLGPGSITNFVQQAQQVATLTCGFLPTVETVAGLIAAGNPAITTATEIADAICSVATRKMVTRSGRAPTVSGVAVKGRFVRS